MEADKMEEAEWKYHGEGNRSLVVAHVQNPRVLRLLKYSAEDAENAPQSSDEAFRQIQNMVDFSSNVMSSLLGKKFVHSGEVVKLPLEFVRQLSIKVQHQRPVWRCDKVMDIYSGCALCLPNLTSPSYPTHTAPLCVEIKPKCGFLPSSKHISKDIKTKVCRFCMHQHYKVANGKWRKRSLYCPLDLFSGNKQRMYFAIKHLIEEPQNNLKVFKGGQCVYGQHGDSDLQDPGSLLQNLRSYFLCSNSRLSNKAVLNDFIQVLVNSLLMEEDGGEDVERGGGGRSVCEGSVLCRELIRAGPACLPSRCVLAQILRTQMFDTLDIEGIFPLYRRVEQYLHRFPTERERLQLDGPYNAAFLEKLQKFPSEDDGSLEYAVAKVQQYRVAMTAKDCSIMLTLQPRGEEEEGGERLPVFSVSASILDLDPKPWDSVHRQQRLDSRVVSFYLRAAALPKGSLPRQPVYLDERTLLFHPV